MSLPKQTWDQLKSTTVEEIISALKKSGWKEESTSGGTRPFRHEDGRRIVIHYHPGKTYGAKFLKGIIMSAGWSQKDLKKLKLIK